MTEEKAKSLIGRKVRGFKFKRGVDDVYYNPLMDSEIGKIGEITDYIGCSFKVNFKGCFWEYPASLIEAHLVEESVSRKISDFKEGEPITETDLIQVNPSEYSCKFANITASELINQNDQLKADKNEVIEALKEFKEYCDYHKISLGSGIIAKVNETLEKHGK